MSELPADPFVEDGVDSYCEDDAAIAVGVAVLECLASGAKRVVVTRNQKGDFSITAKGMR